MRSKIERAYREGYWDAAIRTPTPLTDEDMGEAWGVSKTKKSLEDPKPQLLSDEDKRSICFFILEGDITRWVKWEKKRAQAFDEFPALAGALLSLASAERDLETVANKIGDDNA